MLEEKQKETVKELLKDVKSVGVLFFTSKDCKYCEAERELLQDIASTGKLSVKELDLESAEAKKHGIEKAPALLFEDNPRVRFMGLPSGHEFRTFIDTVIHMGTGKTDINDEAKEILGKVKKPVDLKIFVTPMCPYCAPAVATAHQFAMENEHVTSSMFEAMEFPQLAQKYGVMSVPKIVINEKTSFEGAVPPQIFAKKILESL
jgi:glutaredoxin-like protein